MRFTPFSKEEAEKKRVGLLPEGRYNARVIAATDKVSQSSGNEMIELELEVFGPDGSVVIKDWLIAIDSMAWKTQHFSEAAGLERVYASGSLAETDCVGKSVCVDIKVQQPKPGDKYQRPQNRVMDYMAQGFADPLPARAAQPAKADDEEIPF